MKLQVVFDSTQVERNLIKILENSQQAKETIVKGMARQTKDVIRNVYVAPYRNSGELENSFVQRNTNYKGIFKSTIYTISPYARFFEFPIMKYWYSSKPDPRKMEKYSGIFKISNNKGKTYYQFKPREGHYSMLKGFNHTLNSNFDLAKSTYRLYITRGLL